MKKIRLTLIILLLVTALTGCGFRPRSAADIPPQLHPVYLSTRNPYSAFTTELRAMFKSLHIGLAKSRFSAPYTIKISHYRFTQSNSTITTTTLAVTFTYETTLDISILDPTGKRIAGPKTVSAVRSLVQTASQVYTPGSVTLVKQELRPDVISHIYYFLVSGDTKTALDKFNLSPKKHPSSRGLTTGSRKNNTRSHKQTTG